MTDPVAHIQPLRVASIWKALFDVDEEVRRQDLLAREGRFNGTHILPGGTDLERLAVLAEEFGEVSIEVCKAITTDSMVRREGLYEELIQVAAVSVAWAAAIKEGRQP